MTLFLFRIDPFFEMKENIITRWDIENKKSILAGKMENVSSQLYSHNEDLLNQKDWSNQIDWLNFQIN